MRNYEFFQTSNFREWYEHHIIESILSVLEEFQERDSGQVTLRILDLMEKKT